MRKALMAIALMWLSSCGGDDGGPGLTGEPPEPPPTTGVVPTSTSTDTGDHTGSEETGEIVCGPELPCPDGWHCAAPHQAGLLEAPEPFVCMSACVPAGSTSYWCLDDDSCCEGSICDARYGLCWSDAGTTTGTETGTTDATEGSETEATDGAGTTTDGDGTTGSQGETTAAAETTTGETE